MRILIASSSSGSRGGGELFVRELTHGLASRQAHELIYWCSDHQRMDEMAQEMAKRAMVRRFPYPNTYYDRSLRSLSAYADHRLSREIAADWRTLSPDVVLINKQNLEDGLDLLRAARLARLPGAAVIHLTQTPGKLKAKLASVREWVSRMALRDFGGEFIAVEAVRGEELREFLGCRNEAGGHVHVIENGVRDLLLPTEEQARRKEELRREMEWPTGCRVVLGLGRLMPQKRPELWLELADKAAEKLPDVRFLWVGEGPLAVEFDRKREEMGRQDAIKRLDWVREVDGVLAGADVLLHTAAYEGLPLAILEAMSAEVPVLLPKDLSDGMTALGPDATGVFHGSEAFTQMLGNSSYLGECGREGRRLYEHKFRPETCAAAYEKVLECATEAQRAY